MNRADRRRTNKTVPKVLNQAELYALTHASNEVQQAQALLDQAKSSLQKITQACGLLPDTPYHIDAETGIVTMPIQPVEEAESKQAAV